jgi:GNAT superfamily N-acetyltransferase
MKPPFNLKRLIETERNYAKRFTNVTPKPYGIIYWNEGNKESYASNHAVITDFVGVESSLKDISNYYRAKNITPVLFHALHPNELETLTPALKKYGFEIESLNHEFYLLENEPAIAPVGGIYFERLTSVRDDIRELVLSDSYGEYILKYLERHLKSPGYHLLGGFANDELVTIASVDIFEGYSRIDDIFTHKFYRGKGYSGGMLNHLINYHKKQSENHLYLYSHSPLGASLYEKAGFVKIPNLQAWRAIKTATTQ